MADSIELQVQTVLKYCNEFRKRTGLELLEDLPKGLPYNVHSCPVAKALNHGISAHHDSFLLKDKALAETLASVLGTKARQHYVRDAWLVPNIPDIQYFMKQFDYYRVESYIQPSSQSS